MTLADTPRFVHFSVEPFHGPVRPVSINRQELHSKPRGFWISDESGEDGWADWCLGENFATEALSHAASIELADDAKLLWLKSDADIDHFSRQYGIPEHRFQRTYRVNWRPIAEEFQGIIIESMSNRRGNLLEFRDIANRVRMVFHVPSR